jgi:hypothetical protein
VIAERCAVERTVDGVIERRCSKCRAWWPLDKLRKDKKCARGRANECVGCYRSRKNLQRARTVRP